MPGLLPLRVCAAAWLLAGAAHAGAAPATIAGGIGDRELDNLVAFTRLSGYVRYFHPSDAAAATDWNRFAVDGMEAVQSARDADELAHKLTGLFADIAPTVGIYRTGKAAPPAPLPPKAVSDLRVVAWKHVGIGVAKLAKAYRSERSFKTPAEAAADVEFPSPLEPFLADLGGGVSCSVPLALFAEGATTLPKTATAAPVTPTTTISYSARDRSTRFAAVALGWTIVQHSYPYFDVYPTDWQAVLRMTLRRAAADATERQFLDTLRCMNAALRDGHGRVQVRVRPPDVRLPLRWEWIEQQLVVTWVAPDSASVLSPGDTVLVMDGQPVSRMLHEREALISGATPQWIRSRAVTELLQCEDSKGRTLEVERYAARGKRTTVTVPCLETKSPPASAPRFAEPVAQMEPGIFYVDLERMDKAAFDAALSQLELARGIVFDLRMYPGRLSPDDLFSHLSETPMVSPQWHLPHIVRPDRIGMTFEREGEWRVEPRAPFLRARKAFIVGERTISYAETCAAIVQQHGLGEIVGSPTAGTNGDFNWIALPGGYTMIWTGMKVLEQDGSRHHGFGIWPSIPAASTRAGVAAGRDEALERAVQAVKDP